MNKLYTIEVWFHYDLNTSSERASTFKFIFKSYVLKLPGYEFSLLLEGAEHTLGEAIYAFDRAEEYEQALELILKEYNRLLHCPDHQDVNLLTLHGSELIRTDEENE